MAWAFLLILLILGVGYVGGTLWVFAQAWKRWAQLSLAAKLMAAAVTGSATYGGVLTIVGFCKATLALGSDGVDPSQKARLLAEGIAEAMSCFAFGFIIWLPCVIAYLILAKRAAKPPA